jgi:mRNA interferase MazF
MKHGKEPKSGDIILTKIQFADSFEIKRRPALVLFKEFSNIVVAGITSNTDMKGIILTKKEGAVTDSVIKLNYIFTISNVMVEKILFNLSEIKRRIVYNDLVDKCKQLV